MKKYSLLISIMLFLFSVSLFAQPANFGTSLHKTRAGKNFWYGAENGGFHFLRIS